MTHNTPKRVAAITGGAQGLGLAIAERLGKDGFSLVLCDISERHLREASEHLAKAKFEVTTIQVDVADEASVAKMADTIGQQHGRSCETDGESRQR